MVYKLVAVGDRPGADAPLQPVAKRSPGKATRGGVKLAGRRLDPTGRAVGELVADAQHRPALSDPAIRNLQVPYVRHGEAVGRTDLAEVREHHLAAKAELGPGDLDLSPGPPALRATPIDPLS
jgi:nicotinate phosphoribosyltransferase